MSQRLVGIDQRAKIYIAGHRGLVGSALLQRLRAEGYEQLAVRTHAQLDLTDQRAVTNFFQDERPDYVVLAAARVGGIWANQQFPAEFIYANTMIGANVIHAAFQVGVKRLLAFGSNCAYPEHCPQPMREEMLFAGRLEPTSTPYAVAKLTTMTLCEAYNRQHGTSFISVIPATLYGPHDNFDPQTSHVLAALVQKMHDAISTQQPGLALWGTGTPRREFLYVTDVVEACLLLLGLEASALRATCETAGSMINVGSGEEVSVRQLAELVKTTVGYRGECTFDSSQPDGAPRKLLDSRRIHEFGWSPRVGLREGLRETYRWYAQWIASEPAHVR